MLATVTSRLFPRRNITNQSDVPANLQGLDKMKKQVTLTHTDGFLKDHRHTDVCMVIFANYCFHVDPLIHTFTCSYVTRFQLAVNNNPISQNVMCVRNPVKIED